MFDYLIDFLEAAQVATKISYSFGQSVLLQQIFCVFRVESSQVDSFMNPPNVNFDRKKPLNVTNQNARTDKPADLGFSPSAFLNISNISTTSDLLTSTPARTEKLIKLELPESGSKQNKLSFRGNEIKKRKCNIFDQNFSNSTFTIASPRTPTPLKADEKKQKRTFAKVPSIDEISHLLNQKSTSTLSTPNSDYVLQTVNKSGSQNLMECTELSSGNKDSLRRTLFETPSQFRLKPCGINLFSDKELNAIEQMSSCFTPRRQSGTFAQGNEARSNVHFSVNQVRNDYLEINPVPRKQVKILPLVGKPMKIPIRKLPPVKTNASNIFLQLNDSFKSIACGQSNDQKFLTEQAKLIMKEISQANIRY